MANFDKKWSELSQEESIDMKGQFGSKQAWQDAKAQYEGYGNEADKKANKTTTSGVHQEEADEPTPAQTENRAEALERTQNYSAQSSSTNTNSSGLRTDGYATVDDSGKTVTYYGKEAEKMKAADAKSSKTIDTSSPAYATETGYGADGSLTAKQIEDMGYTPHLYRESDYTQHINTQFFDPNSAEAIKARQEFEGVNPYHTGEIDSKLKNVNHDFYDPSVNEGYAFTAAQGDTPAQHNYDGDRKAGEELYKSQLKDAGMDMNTFNVPRGYEWDPVKGYYVPNTKTRQGSAATYDNMFMREPQNLTTDRKSYIHKSYNPLSAYTS
tara:strand:+ start:300 stop:1274 length:975 start_codon:yes stop_codon:yes gene_type:complete